MTLQNVKNIKGAADKNGLKTLCVNKALITLILAEKYQNQGLTDAVPGFCRGGGRGWGWGFQRPKVVDVFF